MPLGDARAAAAASSSTSPAPLPASTSRRRSRHSSPSSRSSWPWLSMTRPPSNGRGTTTCRALEELAARRCGREDDGVVILDDNDEEASGPSNPVRHSDPGQGCSKVGGGAQDDDGSDYTNFYKLLGM
ncbi:Cysteine-rich receptor-like protein kinase 10 [Hordeum vulgare]|nr:Cysteine-rich receptor-like protein kinase 10 [Hordeum vulgare]